MNDLKVTISRSFSRTIQIKQYEPAQFFANYSMEYPVGKEGIELQNESETLYKMAKFDVQKSMKEYLEEIKAKMVKTSKSKFEKKDERKYDAEMDVGSVEVLQEINN